MRFLLYDDLKSTKGIPYSDRQLKRLESKGAFPRRVPLAVGGSIKGWPETIIDEHFEKLADKCRNGGSSQPPLPNQKRKVERNVG